MGTSYEKSELIIKSCSYVCKYNFLTHDQGIIYHQEVFSFLLINLLVLFFKFKGSRPVFKMSSNIYQVSYHEIIKSNY